MLLNCKPGIIYGPVNSRRLGLSLGVNLLPPGVKTCTLDCLYCQYGRSSTTGIEKIDAASFPSPHRVCEALEEALSGLLHPPAYITFSGNGEPTLHPRFNEIVDAVRNLRDRCSPTSKVAILSNSTTVTRTQTREALEKLDMRIMKFDAGSDEMFSQYNQPVRGISLDEIVEGLRTLGNVTLQCLFSGGPDGNDPDFHVEEWTRKVKKISPLFVQVYSLARQSPTETLTRLPVSQLDAIRRRVENEKIPCSTFE